MCSLPEPNYKTFIIKTTFAGFGSTELANRACSKILEMPGSKPNIKPDHYKTIFGSDFFESLAADVFVALNKQTLRA